MPLAEETQGGVKLQVVIDYFDCGEVEHYGPEVQIVATRSACARLAQILSTVAESAPGSLTPGTPEAARLTQGLNDLLARGGNALFGDCGVDDAVGAPLGRRPRMAEIASGCAVPWLLVVLGVLALRGAFAFWGDVLGR